MNNKLESFFILSNPFFYVLMLGLGVWQVIKWLFDKSTLSSKYYLHFKIQKATSKDLRMIINVTERHKEDNILSNIKLRAWKKASDKAKLILKQRDYEGKNNN